MTISTQDFTTLVRNQVAAIQGAASSLVDLTVGSILRSIVEANAAVILWLQGLILQLLATTRASTSSGADLDSWVADYGLVRLAGVAATGQVTFSRFTPTQQAVVPVGATVQSTDGTQKYTVTLDTGNGAYSSILGGYVLAVSVASVSVPVKASAVGAAGNAVIGGISTMTQAIPGVDTVTNAAALTTGVNAETDAALRVRFVAFIAGLSKATVSAIGYAITSLQQGVSYALVENVLYNGTAQMGYFYVVIDDGTGVPGSTLLGTVSNVVDAVRPACSSFGVFAPVVVTANISMTITTTAGYNHSATAALVSTAISTYINALTLGQSLAYSRLAQVAYDASPGVSNVTTVLINSATSDITATAKQVIKAGTVAIS